MNLEKLSNKKEKESEIRINHAKTLIAKAKEYSEALKIDESKHRSGKIFDENILSQLDNNAELANYICLIIERNDQALQNKDEKIIKELNEYRAEHSITDKEFNERSSEFKNWLTTEGHSFIHSSDKEQPTIVLKSPRETGKTRYMGKMDIYLGHDRFVFGSWQALPHKIASSGNVYHMDPTNMAESFFVPMVIAQVYKQLPDRENFKESMPKLMKYYATNIHRQKDMIDVMSNYFASAFDSIANMKALMSLLMEDPNNWYNQTNIPEHLASSYEKVKEIYDIFGLLPPLASEIQVPGPINATQI